MANPNLHPAIKLLLKDLSSTDLLTIMQAELGNKERVETLQKFSEWASTQLLSAPAADSKVGESFEALSHDNLYATLQKELGKEDRLGVLQCLVDWAVPEHVYAPATAITKVRFNGTVTSFDQESKIGFINCAEATEIFGSDVILEGDQVRKGARENDQLSFAILRDSAHKPQAFDVVNETVANKDADRRRGKGERKGERKGKGKKRSRAGSRVEGEEDGGEEKEAGEGGEDGEDGGEGEEGRFRRKKHGKGKGRKQRRKGEGRDRSRSRDRGKGERRERKGGEKGDRGERKGGEKGSFKGKGSHKGGAVVPQQGGMGLSIKPSGVVGGGLSQMGLVQSRLAALGRGGGAIGQFGKGSLAQSLMRKNLLARGGMIPRPAMHQIGGPIPAGAKAMGKMGNKGGKTENVCWNFKNGKCWKPDCPWAHAK